MINFYNTKHLIGVMDFAVKVGAIDKLLDKPIRIKSLLAGLTRPASGSPSERRL